jgi:hypothetical protein
MKGATSMTARTVPISTHHPVVTASAGGVSLEAASFIVGNSPDNELTVTAKGLTVSKPDYVFLQARQHDNFLHNYPDAFALQVLQVTADSVTFLVKRLDASGGWGQELQVDMLFVSLPA